MSEEILKALMQLFAIIYKQDNGGEDVQNNYVKEFLLSQISLERFDIYYNQYTDYINAESSETGEVKRTSVKDSVRTLAICKRINKTLSQKQKSIVLVRITEFIHITETISPLRLELLATISDVFKIEKIEYENILNFSAATRLEDVIGNEYFQVYLDKDFYNLTDVNVYNKDGLNAVFFFCLTINNLNCFPIISLRSNLFNTLVNFIQPNLSSS